MPSRSQLASFVVAICCNYAAFSCPGSALAQGGFGPETLVRGSGNKDNYTRAFSVSDTTGFFTLIVENGADGARTVKKGWVTLNGKELLNPGVFNRQFLKLSLAVHPRQVNELRIKLKGGEPGSFIRVAIEPSTSTVVNDPNDSGFDANQAGVGVPIGVAVDQTSHRAYVSDRFWDSIIEIDVQSARVTRWFRGLDGDLSPGNGATTGISWNSASNSIVAVNEGGSPNSVGSVAVVGPSGDARVIPLSYEGHNLNPYLVAVNPGNNVAAFSAFYSSGGRAYFCNLTSGAIVVRDEGVSLTAPAYNSLMDQFVYAANPSDGRPSLVVYNAVSPFQRLNRIASSAPAGTAFERLAINPVTNKLVAVNPRDSAVYLFDLSGGVELARIPFSAGNNPYPNADVAINTRTNMAAVISGNLDHVTVINLATQLVAAEIPLPSGSRPLGIGIDYTLNRAVIAENGLASTQRNGSVLVIDLPTP
jgi:DNA-binding beta-propeller fold protein YncE